MSRASYLAPLALATLVLACRPDPPPPEPAPPAAATEPAEPTGPSEPTEPSEPPRLVEPGIAIESTLGSGVEGGIEGGAEDRFLIDVTRGSWWRVEATPSDGEPNLWLESSWPHDELPARIDETWDELAETWIFEAVHDGRLPFTVGAKRPGSYRLVVEPLDEPADRQRRWALAQRRHAEGYRPNSSSIGDPATKVDALSEAAAVWRSLGEPAREALVLETLAPELEDRQRLDGALDAWNRAVDLRDHLGHEGLAALDRNHRGLLLRRLGRAEEARTDFESALAEFGPDQPRHHASLINNLGLLDQDAGQFREAWERFNAARDLLETLPALSPAAATQHALTLENLARLDTVQGRFDAARRNLERAIFLRRSHNSGGLIEPRLELAWLEFLDGSPAVAKGILDELAHQIGGRVDPVALTVFDRLGATREALDDIEGSWAAYRRAEAMARSLGNPSNLGAVANNLCRLTVLHPELAADGPYEICREAVDTMRASGDANRSTTALYWRARQLEARGELDDATALYDEAARALDRLTAHTVGLEGRAHFAEERSDPLRRLIDLSMRRHWRDRSAGHDRRAFLASERLRARGVLLRLLGSEPKLDPTALAAPAARETYSRLVDQLTALEAARREGAGPIEAIEARIATTLDDLDAAEQVLRESSPAYEELRPPEHSLAAYQAALDDQTVVLAVLTGDTESTLWVLTRTTLSTYPLPPRQRIERQARLLRRALAEAHPYNTEIAASRLAKDLFGDDLERLAPLAGRRLVFIGDGALQQLPLSVLPTDAGQRHYVVDDHEVVHLPSLNTLLAMRRLDRPRPEQSIAVFADPIYRLNPRLDLVELDEDTLLDLFGESRPPGRYGRLDFADREADWISEIFPRSRQRIYRGLDASRANALDPELADFSILHFATHGELDPSRPELSALLLSEVTVDGERTFGRLWAQDLANLGWRAELVVASACETGVDNAFRFAGVGGLARALFQAGTPRTIASLWQVETEPTAHLMAAFYQALDRGAAPGQALREARLRLLRPLGDKRRGPWTAPHVWGGFVLVGDWRAFELAD